MTLSEFWRVTPRETVMFIQAARWRREQDQRQALEVAWHTANQAAGAVFGKQKPLDQWLKRPAHLNYNRPKDVAAYLERWASQFPREKKEQS